MTVVDQAITAQGGESPSISNVRQSVVVNPPPSTFRIGVWEVSTAQNRPHRENDSVSKLYPGKSYVLKVWLEVARSNPNIPVSFNADEEIDLELNCDAGQLQFDHNVWGGMAKKLFDSPIEFKIDVPGNHPYQKVNLELTRARGDIPIKTVGEFQIEIMGDYELPPPKELGKLNLDPDVPKSIAVLNIIQQEDDKAEFWGWSYFGRHTDSEPVSLPNINNWYEVENKMLGFSNNIPDSLRNWLRTLKHHNDNYHLLIVDFTATNVPWEMISVEEPADYLGAQIPVSRWIVSKFFGKERILSIQNETCRGRLVGYSKQPKTTCHGIEWLENDQILHNHISEMPKNSGFLYIGHHDIIRYENEYVFKQLDALLHSPQTGLNLHLSRKELKSDALHTLCFVNAKFSARCFRTKNQKVEGLPEAFLSKIASGYIGVMNDISLETADDMEQLIFERMFDGTEAVSPAEILRQLRAEAADRFNPNDSKTLEHFLNVFAYVYYGNPLLVVELNNLEGRDG